MMTSSPPDTPAPDTTPTFDPSEVERFERMSGDWWDPNGKFRPLHRQAPARLSFIRDSLVQHFGLAERSQKPLKGLNILDVGCGGGLISEPLCRLGAHVTGIDPTTETIAIARAHAEAQGLEIDYRAQRAEDLLAADERFDAVVCLEVVEHVPEVGAFLQMLSGLVRPGGLIVLSTLNRTWKSYGLAIVAAEYVLRWLPAGTHDWNRFVTPGELRGHLRAAEFQPGAPTGIVYDLMHDEWRLNDRDLDVNYMIAAARPADA